MDLMDFGSNSFRSPLTISTRRSVTDPNLGACPRDNAAPRQPRQAPLAGAVLLARGGAALSAVVPNVQVLIRCRKLLRRGFGLQCFPGRVEVGLGRVEVFGRAHPKSSGQMNHDVPEPDT